MNPLMNLYHVRFDDSGAFEHIEPSVFVVYEIEPETGMVMDIERFIYPME